MIADVTVVGERTVELVAILDDAELVEYTVRNVTVETVNGPFMFMVIVV